MSRSRLEKDPNRVCGHTWWNNLAHARRAGDCPHTCQLPIGDHGDMHVCCSQLGGTAPVMEPGDSEKEKGRGSRR